MKSAQFQNLGLVFLLSWGVFFSTEVWSAKSDMSEIKKLKSKVKSLQAEIMDMKSSVRSLEEEQRVLLQELESSEEVFQNRFSKVLIPLLSWPSFPPFRRGGSWVEQEHLKLVLMGARERLAREPLELISDREAMMSRAQQKKQEVLDVVAKLEGKEGLLKLQLEELELLQKKFGGRASGGSKKP